MKSAALGFALLMLPLLHVGAAASAIASSGEEAPNAPKVATLADLAEILKPQLSDYDKKRIAKATQEIEQNPNSAAGYLDRAYAYSLCFPDKAIPDFSKAIQLDPKNRSALLSRAKAYTQSDQFSNALSDYYAATKIKASSDVYYEAGSIYQYNLKQPQRSIPFYNASVGLDPFNARAISGRAHAEMDLGQLDKALNDYDKAIDLDPREWGNFMYRAEIYDKLGKKVEAEQDRTCEKALRPYKPVEFYTEAIAQSPNALGIYFLLADRQMYEKEYQSALDTLTHIISVKPTSAEAHYNRAQCWEKLHAFEKALDDYSTAIKLDPTGLQANHFASSIVSGRSAVYDARGSLLYTMSRNQAAIDDYTTALTLEPSNMSAWLGRGCLNSSEGHFFRAIEDLTEATRLTPTNPMVWMARANTFSQMHEHQKSWDDYTRAIEIMSATDFQRMSLFGDPKCNLSDGYRHRGVIAIKLGRQKEASEDFSRAIEIYPACAKNIEIDLKYLQR